MFGLDVPSLIGLVGMIIVVYIIIRVFTSKKQNGPLEGFESEPINKEELQKSNRFIT